MRVRSRLSVERSVVEVEKFAFVDWTIPIHARTRGFSVPPQEMDVYYTVRYNLQWCTLTRPPLEIEPTPRTPLFRRGWVGRFRFLCCVAVLDVAAAPVKGGGPCGEGW